MDLQSRPLYALLGLFALITTDQEPCPRPSDDLLPKGKGLLGAIASSLAAYTLCRQPDQPCQSRGWILLQQAWYSQRWRQTRKRIVVVGGNSQPDAWRVPHKMFAPRRY